MVWVFRFVCTFSFPSAFLLIISAVWKIWSAICLLSSLLSCSTKAQCHYPGIYIYVFNKFTLTALHRVLDWWEKLKTREQVSSVCCATVQSPLRSWSLSHRHKEHNCLNCDFSVKKWECPTEGTSSLQNGMNVFIWIIKLDDYTDGFVSSLKWMGV